MAAVVVTGGGSPLGKEITERFLSQGLDVISIVRAHNGAKDSLKPADGLRVIEADLALEGDVTSVCQMIKKDLPCVWAFVHAAASAEPDNNDINKLCQTFKTNVFSGWVIADACSEKMLKGGRIVYIGSVGHKFGGKEGIVAYGASKYLLEYFPRHVRALAKKNILVNTVQVGVMDGATQQKTGVSADQLAKRQALIPIGRMASVNEISETVMFLCSNSNTYIHGAVIPVTGGE